MVRQFKFAAMALLLSVPVTPGGGVIFAAPQALAQPAPFKPLSPPALSRFVLPKTPVTVSVDGTVPRLTSSESTLFAQRGRGRGRWRGNGGARTAVILGSVAAIAGAAVLVYADRPECRANREASGCGYGTKVLGGAVLAGGAVGITVGALSWR